MTQHELLTAVCGALNTLTGNVYTISYSPLRNLSETARPSVFRFVKPQAFRKEVVHRGALTSVHEIVIGHVAILEGNSDQPIIDHQNEMDAILGHFCGTNNPLKSQGFWVSAAESGPVFDQPVSGEGLEADVRLLCASVLITFKR